jgi:hypothetical protein
MKVSEMNISLDQAIEIHAKVLMRHKGPKAPSFARERAEALLRMGDEEGHGVWCDVAKVVDKLHNENMVAEAGEPRS